MTIPSTDFYRRNITALSEFQPDVAAVVAEAVIPDDVTAATGRDGSSTFTLLDESGCRRWFGHSSMPTISARELFARFRNDDANVLLPGILTGLEPLVVAEKLPPFAAVFVVEDEPAAIKLAMHLHDYTDLITNRRLVFLRSSHIADSLRRLFEVHPGYELPKHILTVPHHTTARISEIQRELENAGSAVMELHGSVVDSCVRTLRERRFGPLPTRPRVAVLSVDARPALIEQVRRIERALVKLDWPHEICVPDAPDRCHLAARLLAIKQVHADWVLFINGSAERVRPLLPFELPGVSWFLSDDGVGQALTPESARTHVMFAASRAIAGALARAGIEADAIERCEVGADDCLYHPTDTTSQSRAATAPPVVVLMDLPDDRAESANITLPSHLALWRAMQDAAIESADRYHDSLVEELFETAQSRSGTTLQDESIRRQFADLLRVRIAPACVGRAAVRALAASGCDFAVWGANWSHHLEGKNVWRGSIPVGNSLNRLFNAAQVVVLPGLSLVGLCTALDVLVVGKHVVCRGSADRFKRDYPGLASAAPFLHFYKTRDELTKTVRRLQSDDRSLPDQCEAARTLVQREHTVAGRLLAMADRLRGQ